MTNNAHEKIIKVCKRGHYVSLNNALLEDTSMSWEEKGMLAYLLSRPPDWQVNVKHLVSQFNCGREKTHSILRRLEKAGHMVRYQPRLPGGKFAAMVYMIFEDREMAQAFLSDNSDNVDDLPIFRNAAGVDTSTANGFSVSGSAVSGSTVSGQPAPNKKNSTNKTESTKTEENKKSLCPGSAEPDATGDVQKPGSSKSRKKKEPTFDPEGKEVALAEYMFRAIRRRDPKFKQPNIQMWAKDIDAILRLDGRDADEIMKLIDWAQNDSFWCANVLCPAKLRKQFDQVRAQMARQKQCGTRYDDDMFKPKSDGTPYRAPEIF